MTTHNNKTYNQNSVQQVLYRQKALPAGIELAKLQDPGVFINRMMQGYIENARIDSKQYIRDRGALSRWLGLMPNVRTIEAPIMYKDPWMGFSQYLLCGLDFDFLMLNVLIISGINAIAMNDAKLVSRIILGVLIAYIIDSILKWLRSYYGR